MIYETKQQINTSYSLTKLLKNAKRVSYFNSIESSIVIIIMIGLILQPIMFFVASLQPPGYPSSADLSDHKRIVGSTLDDFDKNKTFVLTEATILSYKSGMKTIDASGINDQYIAHNGYSNGYVDKFH